jgi:hypothetical protein
MTGTEHSISPRDELLDEIRASRTEIEAIIEKISDEQMVNAVDEGGWALKDHLAHIADWQKHGLAKITSQPAWDAFGIDQATYDSHDVHQINDILFEKNKDRALSDVLNDFRQTHQKILTTLGRMDDDALDQEFEKGFTGKHRTIRDLARGHFVGHDNDHIEDIRALANQQLRP